MTSQKTAIFWAILAAGLYALNAPVSKLLLEEVPPTMMAALLYLGAGIGLAVVRLVQRMTGKGKKEDVYKRQPEGQRTWQKGS